MVAPLPRRRPRGPSRRGQGGRWPEEPVYLLTVVAGLALLMLSTRTFHKRAAERSDALQQLRAAKEDSAERGTIGATVGLNTAGRRGGAASTASSSSLSSGLAAHRGAGSREEEPRQLQEEPRQLQQEPGQGQARLPQRQGQAATLASTHEQALPGATLHEQAPGAGGAVQHAAQQAELQRYCEQHFGLDWLRRWGATARQVCAASRQLSLGEPAGTLGASSGSGDRGSGSGAWRAPSTVTCRSMNDSHMPAGSAPHVLCDVTNLLLDPAKLRRARCPAHRPGYMCTSPTYHRYDRGAFSVDCSWPGFSLDAFSKDHQQDIFGSMLFQPELGAAGVTTQPLLAPPAQVEALPTLFVTREIKEHANVYHTMTDLLNAFITLRMLGWEQQPRQVVLLDAHPPGSLDILWPVAAAGGGPAALAAAREAEALGLHAWEARAPAAGTQGSGMRGEQRAGRLLVRRVQDFKGPTLFRHAAFVPPGYTSLLFAHLYEDASCPLPTRLFAAFRSFLLASFGLGEQAATERGMMGQGRGSATGAGAAAGGSTAGGAAGGAAGAAGGFASGSISTLAVRLISRRPGRGKRKMARQIGNEEELLAALQTLGEAWSREASASTSGAAQPISVSVSLLDFASLTVEQQLAVVQETDILVGMHGAALAHALLLPPHAALVELWPQTDGIWRCYQNFAQWAGALYRRVANRDPSRQRNTPRGDITDVDAAELTQVVRELLPLVAARRAAAGGRGSGTWTGAGAAVQQEEGEEL